MAVVHIIIIYFDRRLYTRDPHQLFELLCIQLRCIAKAYSEGLQKLIKVDTANPIELLNCKFHLNFFCISIHHSKRKNN